MVETENLNPIANEAFPVARIRKATRLLQERLGTKVRLSQAERYRASFDGMKLAFQPGAVVRPRTEADIAAVLELANRHRVPVTVRGAGSSLTGSAAPVFGGWILDLSAWKKIIIDAEMGLARAQAGATVEAVQEAAAEAGWYYPPDPSSKKYCTIGGTIACNAGGMRGGRYGVTRDYVLALRGFLPTGERVQWGADVKKYACGFNLRDLWIGSEGMLGVVTEATLRLIPRPERRATLVGAFADEAAALGAVRRLLGRRILPSILEFLDRYSVRCAERASGKRLFAEKPGRPLMLVEVEGSAAEVEAQLAVVRPWLAAEAMACREAADPAEAEVLWSVRRGCSGAMFALGDAKLNEDIVVPMHHYETLAAFLETLRKSSRLPIATFGHAADGNFHVNIMYHRDNPAECARAEKAVFRLMKKVAALGGAISGEHGIGLAKTPFLRLARSEAEIGAMRAVKRALDPNGILNPGKLFDPFPVWERRPVRERLPWDHA